MNVVESEWWIIDLPPEWDAEQDEDTIIISDEDGVGELAITTLEKENALVSDEELRSFAQEVVDEFGEGYPIKIGELEGYYFNYNDGDDAIRDWYLRTNSLLLLLTYSCALDNKGMDDSAIDEIISTLFIKQEG